MDAGRYRMIATRKNMHGITLIELMIVVVVVAILATVSYPSYREFAAKAKRNEAKAALLQIATNQERAYLQNNTFTQNLQTLGFSATPVFTTASGSYDIQVTAADAANYTATATYRLGGSEAAKCNVFTIDGAGVRTSGPDLDCWSRTR